MRFRWYGKVCPEHDWRWHWANLRVNRRNGYAVIGPLDVIWKPKRG